MKPDQTLSIVEAVRTAWTAGRPIVPILGAGLSADAGIPVIATLKRYLCEYYRYVTDTLYLPGLGNDLRRNPLAGIAQRYRDKPWDCVAEVGWPDRYELAQSLHANCADAEAGIETAEKELVEKLHPWSAKQLDDILKNLLGKVDSTPQSLRETLTAEFEAQLVRGTNRRHVGYALFCNWRRLIQYFTNYRPELADGLFHRLVAGRRPSLSHRYLAFLVRLIGVRSIFTFNFDDLIERALHTEQVEFQTFAMEYGGALPHPALVRDALTVVKMHGGTHALLLDERLDYPLAEDYKERFLEIAGKGSLLLVAGFGTDERRLFDLLETTLTKDPQSRVCWLHFEAGLPRMLGEFADRSRWKGRVLTAPTANPGQVFQHLYAVLAGRHPAGRVAYPTYVHRPYSYYPLSESEQKEWLKPLADEPFLIVDTTGVPEDQYSPRTASEWLIELATYGVRQGYQPLWVDLEASYTLADVVGSIIDQCRALDTQLAPSVMPLGSFSAKSGRWTANEWAKDGVVQTAARRVADALCRSRYLVLLDGLEAYLWPPLVHHGEVRGNEHDQALLAQLEGFLTVLKNALQPFSGSRIAIGLDRSQTRSGEHNPTAVMTKYNNLVGKLIEGGWKHKPLTISKNSFSTTFSDPSKDHPLVRVATSTPPLNLEAGQHDLMWLTLSCVRRGRPLATVRRLLRPFVRGPVSDDLVRTLCDGENGERLGLTRLEGGGLWYHRPVRDYLYAANSRGCGTTVMSELLTLSPKADTEVDSWKVQLAAAQAVLLAATHLRVSGIYYSNVYIQSSDAVAFLEYTYHRQSGIRYLAKLLALLGHPVLSRDALIGINLAGKYARPANGEPPPDEWFRVWEGLYPRAEIKDTLFYTALNSLPNDTDFAIKLIQALAPLHAREIDALACAWVRAEPVLREQLPAQQLVVWCAALVSDKPSQYLDRVPILHDNKLSTYPAEAPLSAEASSAVQHLVDVVTDFRVKMLFDRGDYDLAARCRLEQLASVWAPVVNPLRQLVEGEIESGLKSIEQLANLGNTKIGIDNHDRRRQFKSILGHAPKAPACFSHLHHLLDVAACVIKSRQETGTDPHRAIAVMDAIGLALQQIEELYSTAGNAEVREARLRWHYFRAEASVGDVCIFTQSKGFLGRPAERLTDLEQLNQKMKEAEKDVNSGMAALRAAPPRTDGRLRSLMLDPIDGGWLYLPYRSAFHTVQGRLRWLQAARTVNISRENLHEGFRTAFECFDLARGGLEGNHQIAALNELFRVEACLARARILLYPSSEKSTQAVADLLQQAGAKYEAARAGLQTARKHLLTGRRNVIWWKLFYALAAQYHADRLLAGVARLANEPPRTGASADHTSTVRDSDNTPERDRFRGDIEVVPGPVRLWEVVARLRRGYRTVRAGLDLQPIADPTGDRGWKWLGRAWAEMTGAAYLTGRFLIARAPEPCPDRNVGDSAECVRHDAVVNALRGLNAAARLDEADLNGLGSVGDWSDSMNWYQALFVDGCTRSQALHLRLNVLRRAIDPASLPGWNMDDI
ncbi:unnamed protein product [Gemmata massiliana]|uniref:Uncharacterized protein n=1 Tax=Gemmata massiliana TaxID=1210884 RepID=A0A6P2CWV8_9BACT|nr:SIR2 family protein [Gemmata massiliana]VTR91650.1 unnamed protein product [Gemmata massiliana]